MDSLAIAGRIGTSTDHMARDAERSDADARWRRVTGLGPQAKVRACEVMEVEDSKIKSTHHYFDLMTIL